MVLVQDARRNYFKSIKTKNQFNPLFGIAFSSLCDANAYHILIFYAKLW
jgi:hypothetical protein